MTPPVRPVRRHTTWTLALAPLGVIAVAVGLNRVGILAGPVTAAVLLGALVAHPLLDGVATFLHAAPRSRGRWRTLGLALVATVAGVWAHLAWRHLAPGGLPMPPMPPAVRIGLLAGLVVAGGAITVRSLSARRRRRWSRWSAAAGVLAGAAVASGAAWLWAFRAGLPLELLVPLGSITLAISGFGAYLMNHVTTVGAPVPRAASPRTVSTVSREA